MKLTKFASVAALFAVISLFVWADAPEAQAAPDDCIVASGLFSGSTEAGPYTLPEGERIVIKVTNRGDETVFFTLRLNASNLPVTIPTTGGITPGETERFSLRATEDITVSASVSVTAQVYWEVQLGECEEPATPLDDRLPGTGLGVAMYYDQAGAGSLTVYSIDENSNGVLAFVLTADELAEWEARDVAENTLIAQTEDGSIALYKLTTGEYQINAGPDPDGKVEVTIFDGFPPSNTYGYTFNVNE